MAALSGSVWRIWEAYENAPFFGGDATLTYKLMKGGNQVLAPQIIRFRIGGRNPDDARCRAYTESRPELCF